MKTNYVPDASRHDFYRAIHKALRLGHCRMLPALGALDHRDRSRSEAVLAELRGLMELGRAHLEGENREIHAALEQRAPGASAHAADDHEEHEESFAEIEALIVAIEQAPAAERELAGRRLYRRYAVFVAHDLEHMDVEESELLTTLQEHFSDAELIAMEARIIASHAPEKMAAAMKLMAPALNHGERVELLDKLQKALPPPAFDGLLVQAIKPALESRDYAAAIGELMLRAA